MPSNHTYRRILMEWNRHSQGYDVVYVHHADCLGCELGEPVDA